MKTLNSIFAFTLAGLIAGGVQAGPTLADAPSTVVNFADLNLHNAVGIAQLHARIHAAAREVCGSDATRDLREAQRVRACITSAVARARAEVSVVALSKLASSAAQ